MDRLWSPWRYNYVTAPGPKPVCVFCEKLACGDDTASLIVHRARENFVLLNLYPYNSGHLMIAPFRHVATLEDSDPGHLTELMLLARRAETILRAVYRCPGLNLGFNLGACAGAGVAGHLHLHIVPRWEGDTNFLGAVGETRVLPEDLAATYKKLVQQDWNLL
ncbi:MAG: HIT domain-containing protein [Acidobacteria bacterium]|nr:HIT domain-containing protein [Acidobacteriota bacterium]